MINSYVAAARKQAVRQTIFDSLKGDVVIGLAGPDAKSYVMFFRSRGFSSVLSWELDPNVLQQQRLQTAQMWNVSMNEGNIVEAPLNSEAIYDLDFCKSAKSVQDCIAKFKNVVAVFTFCTRNHGIHPTVRTVFQARGERIIGKVHYKNHEGHVTTVLGKYGLKGYRGGDDGTGAPMVMIYPIK